jgi:hypothetical protein
MTFQLFLIYTTFLLKLRNITKFLKASKFSYLKHFNNYNSNNNNFACPPFLSPVNLFSFASTQNGEQNPTGIHKVAGIPNGQFKLKYYKKVGFKFWILIWIQIVNVIIHIIKLLFIYLFKIQTQPVKHAEEEYSSQGNSLVKMQFYLYFLSLFLNESLITSTKYFSNSILK